MNSQIFNSKSIPNLEKFPWRKLLLSSKPSQPHFISNCLSSVRFCLDWTNFEFFKYIWTCLNQFTRFELVLKPGHCCRAPPISLPACLSYLTGHRPPFVSAALTQVPTAGPRSPPLHVALDHPLSPHPSLSLLRAGKNCLHIPPSSTPSPRRTFPHPPLKIAPPRPIVRVWASYLIGDPPPRLFWSQTPPPPPPLGWAPVTSHP
jgi:hypothetical protein